MWPARYRSCCDKYLTHYTSRTLGWISAGHVCGRLREAVLGYRSLWASAFGTFPDTEAEFLARAGALPITVTIDTYNEVNCQHVQNRVQFTKENLHRAKEVTIYLGDHSPESDATYTGANSWPHTPLSFSGTHLPHLEKLVHRVPSTPDYIHQIDGSTYALPPIRAPCLRVLSFINWFVPFDSSKLVVLRLQNPFDIWRSSEIIPLPSSTQFFDILRSCTSLQQLTLISWIPDISSTLSPTIYFPNLTRLHISDIFSRCLALRSHLAVSPNTKLAIEAARIPQEALETGGFMDSFADHFLRRPWSLMPVDKLEVAFEGVPTYSFDPKLFPSPPYICEDRYYFHDEDGAPTWRFHFFASRSFHRTDFMLGFKRVLEHINITQVRHMSISCIPQYSPATWRGALAHFTNLSTLREDHALNFPMVLSAVTTDTGSPLLPALRHLELHRLILDPESIVPLNQSDPAKTCSQLIAILKARKTAGVPIESLHIAERVQSINPDQDITELRALISEVQVERP